MGLPVKLLNSITQCSGVKNETSTRVNSSTNDTTQRVPCSIIKPVVEAVESLLCQVARGSVVEVGIELVNNTLKSQHREQTCGKC